MKKFLYIVFTTILLAGCKQDENVVSGIAASFYPLTVAAVEEEGGVVTTVTLEASGALKGRDGYVDVLIDSEVQGSIAVEDADGNDITPAPGTPFRVQFQQDTVDSGNGNRIQVIGRFSVDALNDLVPDDYTAELRIVGVGGAITDISSTNVFTLQVKDTDTAPIFSDDFENGLGQWTIINVDGNNTWATTAFNGNTSALSSTFGSSDPAAEDNWLISPLLNFDSFGEETLTFLTKGRFNSFDNQLEVSILQNFDGSDPLTADQVLLNPTLDPHEGGGFGNFTESGDIDLSSVAGSGHLAFRFKAVSASDGAGWEVDDVEISIFDADASGGGPDNIINLPFSEDFENCTTNGGISENFIEQFAAGAKTDRGWGCAQTGVDGSRAIRANAFGGSAGDEDAWLVSAKRFNLQNVSNATLSFDVKSENDGPGNLRVYYTANYFGGDPTAFTWTELDVSAQLPAKESNSYSSVNASLIGAVGRNVYIAFRFDGASAISSATYDLDNIAVEAGAGPGGDFSLPFTDDFESCVSVGQFNIPTNWIEEVVPGSKTDRGWGCRDSGRSGWAPRASAFGGEDGTDDAWLITNGTLDLSSVTTATLVVWVESRFSGPGDLEINWSADYAGSGDPTAATWTTLSDVAAQLPADGSDTFTEVTSDLSGAAGNQIYLAFRYFGGTAGASIALTIDDVSVTGN